MTLEKKIKYKFNNPLLLETALTHRSICNEKTSLENNERFEFLGDSLLNFTVSSYLYECLPYCPEGELTKIRARAVCEEALFECALRISLGKFIKLGKGEETSGGRARASILADAMEAVFAAVFLDGGIENAKQMILSLLKPEIDAAIKGKINNDYKTVLQEVLRKSSQTPPHYEIVCESGPAHSQSFTVEVLHEGRVIGRGEGRSKKEAQKNAAKSALGSIEE